MRPASTPGRRCRRAGFSLVELVMLVGCTTIILSTCGVFFHVLLKLDRAGRDASRDAMTVGRLARQFRRDVHAARRANSSDPSRLELTGEAGATVRYHAENGRLTRVESRQGQPDRRESFDLLRYATARFRREAGERRVVLDVPRKTGALPATGRLPLQIEGDLDRDARRSAPTEGGAK